MFKYTFLYRPVSFFLHPIPPHICQLNSLSFQLEKKNVKERKITHKLEPFCVLKFWHDHYIALVVGLHNKYRLEKSLTAWSAFCKTMKTKHGSMPVIPVCKQCDGRRESSEAHGPASLLYSLSNIKSLCLKVEGRTNPRLYTDFHTKTHIIHTYISAVVVFLIEYD